MLKSNKKSFAILSIIVGATGIGLGMYSIATVASTLNQTEVLTESSSSNTKESHHLILNGFPSLGAPDASVTIVEYGDYQCKDCQRFAAQTKPLIIENYVNNGKAKLIFKDFIVYGSDSVSGALATHCAGDQGKFWEMHDLIYQKQNGIDSDWLSIDNIRKFASEIQLDMQKFNSCFDGKKYVKKIAEGLNEGKAIGVNETPTFIIIDSSGEMMTLRGAQDFGAFKQVLDTMLEN
ncbi:MAG: DsbA family protein [Nitrososphaerales archaeon]